MKPPLSHTYLEAGNLILDIVFDVSVPRAVSGVESAQLALESLLIQNLADAHTTARSLITVAGADTLTGGADLTATKTLLLQTIDDRVQVEADVRAVRDEDALSGALQALRLDGGQLLEETGHVEDGTGTNQVDTLR